MRSHDMEAFPENSTAQMNSTSQTNYTEEWFYMSLFRHDTWAIVLITLSALNLVTIVLFEVYVLYKSCGNRRHLFLGQILLLGLFASSALGFAFVTTPSLLTCALTRAGIGIAYVWVLAALVVKLIFLLNLHSGIYFSAANQGFLLFFILAVQVVITVQWMVYRYPEVLYITINSDVSKFGTSCQTPALETIKYLSYATLLIVLLIVLSIKSWGLLENNKEASYIGFAVALLVPVWVAWTSVSTILGKDYADAAEGFGLVVSASIIFGLVFIPKALQLWSPEKSNVDRLSYGSHSVYTPSFLHLQPQAILPTTSGTLIKYPANTENGRGPSGRFQRYEYSNSRQVLPDPNGFNAVRKPNVTFAHAPLY